MKKSTVPLLTGVLVVGLLAYFFLYKRREMFEGDDDYEGFVNMCQEECAGIKGHIGALCMINCNLKAINNNSRNWKCGTKKAGPKCKGLEEEVRKVFLVFKK